MEQHEIKKMIEKCGGEELIQTVLAERMKLHNNPTHFVQVVENALDAVYCHDQDRWNQIYDFYERRYLNPDSPEKKALHLYGHVGVAEYDWKKMDDQKMPPVITPDLAWRLRERGLLLSVDANYSTERLKEIAILQDKIMKEMQALDNELIRMTLTAEEQS